ncbi:MAG: glycosyltransferase [Candidatus Aureabacteria bacterium]|nr:glycosyltransferase [Candidatus Auribacterota bacterium]
MKKKISVIIPSFNSVLTISRVLDVLSVQMGKGLISEVIVVDSSNDGATKSLLSRYEPDKIKVIAAGERIIPAIGRNMGALRANGEILAFIDADAYPGHDWSENIEKAYENGCMVGGGGIEMADFQRNKPIAGAQYYLQLNEYMCIGRDKVKKFVSGCNMFCDRKLFQKIGRFPEIRAAEEVLFGLKVSKVERLWFIPNAKVHHIFREDWGGFFRNQMLLGKYISIYRKQYYNSFIYKGAMPIILLPGFFCVKLFRIIFRISQAGWHHVYHFVMVFPAFLLGLLFWSIGFIAGCLNNKNENKDV